MNNSIQHFCSEGVKNLEKVMADYAGDMTKIAEMVEGVFESLSKEKQSELIVRKAVFAKTAEIYL